MQRRLNLRQLGHPHAVPVITWYVMHCAADTTVVCIMLFLVTPSPSPHHSFVLHPLISLPHLMSSCGSMMSSCPNSCGIGICEGTQHMAWDTAWDHVSVMGHETWQGCVIPYNMHVMRPDCISVATGMPRTRRIRMYVPRFMLGGHPGHHASHSFVIHCHVHSNNLSGTSMCDGPCCVCVYVLMLLVLI